MTNTCPKDGVHLYGRAYGDAAVNPDLPLSMLAMDRILAFDDDTGLLTCEAGVLLDDIGLRSRLLQRHPPVMRKARQVFTKADQPDRLGLPDVHA